MGFTPILVSAYGRNGSTALMALLGTDPRVRFDRVYPFEHRHLTYLTKFALLNQRQSVASPLGQGELCDYYDHRLSNFPWVSLSEGARPETLLGLSTAEVLPPLWQAFAASVVRQYPKATHYAEKVPAWMPAAVRALLPCRTVHLVRDPRDVFLSANAFMKARHESAGFGRQEQDTDLDHARNLAGGLLDFFENARADQGRPDCLLIRYEDLIRDREGTTRKLNDFLGLKLDPNPDRAIRDYLQTHRTSPSVDASVGRWRREPVAAGVIETLEGPLHAAMSECGYAPVSAPVLALPPFEFPASLKRRDRLYFSPHGKMKLGPTGTADVTVTGEDFYVELPPAPFAAPAVQEVWLCFKGRTGNLCSLYWNGPREGFSDERVVHGNYLAADHWQVMRFPVATHPRWRGTVERLRVDAFNGPVEKGFAGQLRWLRLVPTSGQQAAAAAA